LRINYHIIGTVYKAVVICPNPFILHSVAFHIDTGCNITTISLNDALNMKLYILT